jgi:class 3 adenylate cyclase
MGMQTSASEMERLELAPAAALFRSLGDPTRLAIIRRLVAAPARVTDLVDAIGSAQSGLHTGECEVRGDDIGGIAVHIGARVSALAGPNDVLVSSTLRDLVIGSGLEFDDRGTHELKGVPGEWHLFAVAS